MDEEQWEACTSTTNPVESISESLCQLSHLYRVDKVYVAKKVAEATSLPRIEIRQRVVKKKNEKGKESGGVEATSKKTILKVISCQFNEIANSYGIIKRCFYCDET